ncbi:winged helix-turn-helix domain-containing protein [Burkholderia sp. BKH01]|uniref:winged helix-turn-helix domain-containing protein n=1 Tax=Burkholderia sp. BKH01 TaxID=2769262 RepID=UPI0021DFF708|nr:winged helix-turn-helix domain-containing protein [Burkholderia sp. BKH01]MCU9954051.1 winged helix-turn-helix domain-containing protein [Burkholderia sp. BKH01]
MSEPTVVIAIVDEDRLIRHFVRVALKAEHMHVCEAATGVAGVAAVAARRPDLIVAETNLCDLGGTELIRALRACSDVPLIVLSALSAEGDKVAALDAGADDYLTKPFGAAELIARIRAHLRRQAGGGRLDTVRVHFGDVTVDLGDRQVLRDGARVHLSPIEYRLLAVLAHHAGRLLTHDRLLSEVWGAAHGKDAHYLRVYVGHLRRKLECDPRRPEYIVTEMGVGYRLAGAA